MKWTFTLALWMACALLVAVSPTASADTFELISPVESHALQFHDELVEIRFALAREDGQYRRIAFSLTNLSQEAIAIDWNTSSVTLPSREASNVIHEGVRFMNINSYIAPTTVPPGSRVTNSVIPTSGIEYSSSDWQILSMGIDEGDDFGIYLSLIVDGASRGYAFRFRAAEIANLRPVARFTVDGEPSPSANRAILGYGADEKVRVTALFLNSESARGWVVGFAGSGSRDADGMIASYTWSFGDGSSGSGFRVSHAYDSPGSYEVGLVVTDDKGATASATRAILVVDSMAQSWKETLGWLLLAGLAFGLAWLLGLAEI